MKSQKPIAPPSAAALGYSSWPPWDGRTPVPRVSGIEASSSQRGSFSPVVAGQPRSGLRRRPSQQETMKMRFYTQPHRFYVGVDLHARSLYLCVLDAAGAVAFHGNLQAQPQALAQALAPFHEPSQPGQLVLACECMFAWYWLADWCHDRGIPFVLGHALYMKAIHGGKQKNDKIDAHKIATLLRGGLLPQAYVYPKAMRATRDLLRRRMFLV